MSAVGRIGGWGYTVYGLCVLCAVDYQNVLDETIAMYVLMGVAVVYFAFTGILLALAL